MSRSLSYLRRGLLGIAFVGCMGFGAAVTLAESQASPSAGARACPASAPIPCPCLGPGKCVATPDLCPCA
jgi:hypothetical protein